MFQRSFLISFSSSTTNFLRRFNAPSNDDLYKDSYFPHVEKPISTSEVESIIYLRLSACTTSGALAFAVNKSRVVFRVSLERRHFCASLGSERRRRDSITYTSLLETTLRD